MKKKPKGVIRGGYGFMFSQSRKTIAVTNLKTFQTMHVGRPYNVVNLYDLKIFAAGFAVAKDPGWAQVI